MKLLIEQKNGKTMKLNDNVEKFKFEQMPLTIFYVEKNSSIGGSTFFNISGPHIINTLEISYKPIRRSDNITNKDSNKNNVASFKITTENKTFEIHKNSPIIAFTEFKEATDFIKKLIEKKD